MAFHSFVTVIKCKIVRIKDWKLPRWIGYVVLMRCQRVVRFSSSFRVDESNVGWKKSASYSFSGILCRIKSLLAYISRLFLSRRLVYVNLSHRGWVESKNLGNISSFRFLGVFGFEIHRRADSRSISMSQMPGWVGIRINDDEFIRNPFNRVVGFLKYILMEFVFTWFLDDIGQFSSVNKFERQLKLLRMFRVALL